MQATAPSMPWMPPPFSAIAMRASATCLSPRSCETSSQIWPNPSPRSDILSNSRPSDALTGMRPPIRVSPRAEIGPPSPGRFVCEILSGEQHPHDFAAVLVVLKNFLTDELTLAIAIGGEPNPFGGAQCLANGFELSGFVSARCWASVVKAVGSQKHRRTYSERSCPASYLLTGSRGQLGCRPRELVAWSGAATGRRKRD